MTAIRPILLRYHLQPVKRSAVAGIFVKTRLSETRTFSWLLLQYSSTTMAKLITAKLLFGMCLLASHEQMRPTSGTMLSLASFTLLEEALGHPLESGFWQISEPLPLDQTVKGRPVPVICKEQKAFFSSPHLVYFGPLLKNFRTLSYLDHR